MDDYWYTVKKVKIRGRQIDVLLFLDENESLGDHIKIQTMINEYYLSDAVIAGELNDRDFMYDLIKHFPIKVLQNRLEILAIENGVFDE